MHMKIVADQNHIAYPLFGVNASHDALGVLMVTMRTGSPSTTVSVLPFAPPGNVQADGRIIGASLEDEISLVTSVLVPEGGFGFDGMWLSDVQYLVVDEIPAGEEAVIDVSFLPTCQPVKVVP